MCFGRGHGPRAEHRILLRRWGTWKDQTAAVWLFGSNHFDLFFYHRFTIKIAVISKKTFSNHSDKLAHVTENSVVNKDNTSQIEAILMWNPKKSWQLCDTAFIPNWEEPTAALDARLGIFLHSLARPATFVVGLSQSPGATSWFQQLEKIPVFHRRRSNNLVVECLDLDTLSWIWNEGTFTQPQNDHDQDVATPRKRWKVVVV